MYCDYLSSTRFKHLVLRIIRDISLCLLLISGFTSINHVAAHQVAEHEEDIHAEVVLGTNNAPPYIIESHDTGFEIEIIRAAFRQVNIRVRTEYMPIGRAVRLLSRKRIDVVAPLFSTEMPRFYESDPHVFYRPAVFSLSNDALEISKLVDLKNHSIVTFQGASGYFGRHFRLLSKESSMYLELSDISRIVHMLYKNRTDTVVLDYHVFDYYRRANEYSEADTVFHDVFRLVPAVSVFHDMLLKEKFNMGLSKLIESGGYERILNKYLADDSVKQILIKMAQLKART